MAASQIQRMYIQSRIRQTCSLQCMCTRQQASKLKLSTCMTAMKLTHSSRRCETTTSGCSFPGDGLAPAGLPGAGCPSATAAILDVRHGCDIKQTLPTTRMPASLHLHSGPCLNNECCMAVSKASGMDYQGLCDGEQNLSCFCSPVM